jgi:uncharacterized membrane protein
MPGVTARLERRMGKDVERIAFFSDAVFAIAITLLSIRIAVPPGETHLGRALAENWREYLSFALTFYVIGSYWISDHAMFRLMHRYDGVLLRVNLLFLATIAFLPFPTEVIGRYAGRTPAVVLYAACVAACSLTMSLLWRTAYRRGLLDPELPRRAIVFYRRRGVVAALPFLVSIPVAFVAPIVAMFIWASLIPLGWLGERYGRRLLAQHGAAAGGPAPPPTA